MSIAALVLHVDSPLDQYPVAGQAGRDFVLDAARGSARHLHEAGPTAQPLAPLYQAWLDQGVDRVLLLSDNRPLITADLLPDLVSACAGPLVLARDRTGRVAAGCVALDWLVARLPVASPDLDLDALALGARAPTSTGKNWADCIAVVDFESLADAECLIHQRINLRWLRAGVHIVDPTTTYIDAGVVIGSGATILPNTHLWGPTTVGEASRIGPNSILRDAAIGCHCTVVASVVEEAVMEDHAAIGPFGHLRKGARLCRGSHMGNYGEMKNSTLGPGSKMGHFGYLGDATVGQDVNIGAGTITCNFDGERKHRTVIGDRAFIGSDTMLVAPVEIGAGARVGAGSVVTHDIPAGAVAYGVPARIRRILEQEEDNGPSE